MATMVAATIPLKSALRVNWGKSVSCGPAQPVNAFHVAGGLVAAGCIVPVGVLEARCSVWPCIWKALGALSKARAPVLVSALHGAILKLAPALGQQWKYNKVLGS